VLQQRCSSQLVWSSCQWQQQQCEEYGGCTVWVRAQQHTTVHYLCFTDVTAKNGMSHAVLNTVLCMHYVVMCATRQLLIAERSLQGCSCVSVAFEVVHAQQQGQQQPRAPIQQPCAEASSIQRALTAICCLQWKQRS
jgi:hypothetical protein